MKIQDTNFLNVILLFVIIGTTNIIRKPSQNNDCKVNAGYEVQIFPQFHDFLGTRNIWFCGRWQKKDARQSSG